MRKINNFNQYNEAQQKKSSLIAPSDQEVQDAEKYLEIGHIYTVGRTVVYQSCTDVYLEEIPNKCFNSRHFSI